MLSQYRGCATSDLPRDEAWLSFHATNVDEGQMPISYNPATPENLTGGTSWEQVSNTPLCIALRTMGSLLADSATIMLIGQLPIGWQQRHS